MPKKKSKRKLLKKFSRKSPIKNPSLKELEDLYKTFTNSKSKVYGFVNEKVINPEQTTKYIDLIRSIDRSIDLVISIIENRN